MLVHDSFSSIGVTLATLASVTFGGDWRYVGRTRSLAEYRRERLSGARRAANTLRQLAQLPWFAWNVAIKVLIAAHVLRRDWPY
jgi:phage-related tail protein